MPTPGEMKMDHNWLLNRLLSPVTSNGLFHGAWGRNSLPFRALDISLPSPSFHSLLLSRLSLVFLFSLFLR